MRRNLASAVVLRLLMDNTKNLSYREIDAKKEINAMSNMELLELIARVIAEEP